MSNRVVLYTHNRAGDSSEAFWAGLSRGTLRSNGTGLAWGALGTSFTLRTEDRQNPYLTHDIGVILTYWLSWSHGNR